MGIECHFSHDLHLVLKLSSPFSISDIIVYKY